MAGPQRLVIDAHVHAFSEGYFPPEWFDARASQWAGSSWPTRDAAAVRDKVEEGLVDAHGRMLVDDLNYAGISRAICIGLDPWPALSKLPGPSGLDQVKAQARPMQASPGTIEGFVGLDPRRPDVGELLHVATQEMAFSGVKIYPPHGYMPSDPACREIYSICETNDLPVMFHTALARYPLRSHHANPLFVQDVQWQHPGLRIILAHGGYPVWAREAAIVAAGHAQTYVEMSNWNKMIDSDPRAVGEVLRMWRDEVGAHRVLFASDYFSGPRFQRGRTKLKAWVDFVANSDIFNDEETRLVLGENTLRLLEGRED